MLIATHSANRAKKGVQSVSIRKQNSGDKTLIVLGEVRGQVAAVCWPSYAGWRFGLAARGRTAETAQNLVLSRLESMSIFNIGCSATGC